MRIIHKIIKRRNFYSGIRHGHSACEKVDDNPPLGDYPKDSNPPGGPIKILCSL